MFKPLGKFVPGKAHGQPLSVVVVTSPFGSRLALKAWDPLSCVVEQASKVFYFASHFDWHGRSNAIMS